jgi:RNA polymerase sigma factor (TIGR02999 family)
MRKIGYNLQKKKECLKNNLDEAEQKNITAKLRDWNRGNHSAAEELMPLVYDELHKVAAQYLRKERSGHTLQPTALVNEAYLILVDISSVEWQDRAHFFAVSSNVMRRILVDHARAQATDKRGGSVQKVELDEAVSFSKEKQIDLLALNDALERLAELDERQSQIVEMRFFGGLSVEETAEVLKVSTRTIKREWAMAKAWLFQQMKT